MLWVAAANAAECVVRPTDVQLPPLLSVGFANLLSMTPEFRKWKCKNSRSKRYLHFDLRVSLKTAWAYVSDEGNVCRHSFYPFIHFSQNQVRFRDKKKQEDKKRKDKKKDSKNRDLFYCSHIDRYVYSFYGFKLNEKYNEWVKTNGLSEVAVAYRTDLRKSTIHFAKQVFDGIRKVGPSEIFVGDFTSFFDNLDHVYLKERLKELLAVTSLPDDYYNIYKNITRYSSVELEDLVKIVLNLPHGKEVTREELRIYSENSKDMDRLFSPKFFRQNKKRLLHVNKNKFGIPQGSPISAVLSNIYLMKFDKDINDYVTNLGGFYLRYCDDFIIVIPSERANQTDIKNKIRQSVGVVPQLTLKDEKLQFLHFNNSEILCGVEKACISFLGFSFDGHTIRLRDKTISRYYGRLHRKIRTINYQRKKKLPGGGTKNLYKMFSKNGVREGNFLTYVNRAKRIMGSQFSENITRGHFVRMRRWLHKRR